MRVFDPKRAKVKAVAPGVDLRNEPPPAPPQPAAPQQPTSDLGALATAISGLGSQLLAQQQAIAKQRTGEMEQAVDAMIKTVREVTKDRRPRAWVAEITNDKKGNPVRVRLTPEAA